jgi:hypothetical protein
MMKKLGILSLFLIALCVVALLTVPPLREELRSTFSLIQRGSFSPTQEQLTQAARRLPPSPETSIALAQIDMAKATQELQSDEDSKPNQLPLDVSVFQKAVEEFPDSPAPHLQLGLQLLLRCGQFLRPEAWGNPPTVVSVAPQAVPFRVQAAQQLRLAASLAPKNAAPDYFLAALLFAQGDFAEAETSLRTALGKPEWSLYTREARLGLLALYQASQVPDFYQPFVVPSVGPGVTGKVYYRIDFLGQMLVGLEMQQLAAGRTNNASFYIQSLLHLGGIILQGADATEEVNIGAKFIALPVVPFVSKEKRNQLLEHFFSPAEKEIVQIKDDAAFRAFLAAQKRQDLTWLYDGQRQGIEDFRKASSKAGKESFSGMAKAFTASVVLLSVVSLLQAGFVLLLYVLALVFSLLLWGGRGPGKAPVWRWWEWLLLMIFSFGPAYLAVTLTLPQGEKTFLILIRNQMTAQQLLALQAGAFALLLPFLVPLIGGLLKRPPSERERIGKFHSCLSSWRTLLLPTFALLLVAALGFGYLAHRHLQPWVAKQNQIMQKGVVSYYKLIPPQ